jgi:hypothetical protein
MAQNGLIEQICKNDQFLKSIKVTFSTCFLICRVLKNEKWSEASGIKFLQIFLHKFGTK